jgi:hypothetical protein
VFFDIVLAEVPMTNLLQKAFDEASKLPEPEQDALGRLLLDELASDRRWEELFAGSHDVLAELADEALAEHRAGRTEKLDPDKL